MAEGVRPEAAAQLAAEPALWGYHLADEPKADTFPSLAEQLVDFRQADSRHPANVNMVCYARELLYLYMKTVKPEILSYDHYQWWWGSHSHLKNSNCTVQPPSPPAYRNPLGRSQRQSRGGMGRGPLLRPGQRREAPAERLHKPGLRGERYPMVQRGPPLQRPARRA